MARNYDGMPGLKRPGDSDYQMTEQEMLDYYMMHGAGDNPDFHGVMQRNMAKRGYYPGMSGLKRPGDSRSGIFEQDLYPTSQSGDGGINVFKVGGDPGPIPEGTIMNMGDSDFGEVITPEEAKFIEFKEGDEEEKPEPEDDEDDDDFFEDSGDPGTGGYMDVDVDPEGPEYNRDGAGQGDFRNTSGEGFFDTPTGKTRTPEEIDRYKRDKREEIFALQRSNVEADPIGYMDDEGQYGPVQEAIDEFIEREEKKSVRDMELDDFDRLKTDMETLRRGERMGIGGNTVNKQISDATGGPIDFTQPTPVTQLRGAGQGADSALVNAMRRNFMMNQPEVGPAFAARGNEFGSVFDMFR